MSNLDFCATFTQLSSQNDILHMIIFMQTHYNRHNLSSDPARDRVVNNSVYDTVSFKNTTIIYSKYS